MNTTEKRVSETEFSWFCEVYPKTTFEYSLSNIFFALDRYL